MPAQAIVPDIAISQCQSSCLLFIPKYIRELNRYYLGFWQENGIIVEFSVDSIYKGVGELKGKHDEVLENLLPPQTS